MIISDLTQLFDNKQGGISPTNPTNIWQVNDAGVYPENFCSSSSRLISSVNKVWSRKSGVFGKYTQTSIFPIVGMYYKVISWALFSVSNFAISNISLASEINISECMKKALIAFQLTSVARSCLFAVDWWLDPSTVAGQLKKCHRWSGVPYVDKWLWMVGNDHLKGKSLLHHFSMILSL